MSVAIYKNGKIVPVAGNADTSLTADNIAEILGYTPANSSDVSNLTVNLGDKVDKVEGKDLSTNDLTDELKTSYDDAVELVNKLGADATVEGSVAQRLAAIVANAPEKYDTLKEIATWIESDTDGAAKMQADIATLEADKLDKTSVSSWAKASTKPEYAASEINMTDGTSVESAIDTLYTRIPKVKDIGTTNIAFLNTTNYVPTSATPLRYCISNGICYVTGGVDCITPAPLPSPVVATLPAPKIDTLYFKGFVLESADDETPCRIYIGSGGTMQIKCGTENGSYRFSFSYPVSEN